MTQVAGIAPNLKGQAKMLEKLSAGQTPASFPSGINWAEEDWDNPKYDEVSYTRERYFQSVHEKDNREEVMHWVEMVQALATLDPDDPASITRATRALGKYAMTRNWPKDYEQNKAIYEKDVNTSPYGLAYNERLKNAFPDGFPSLRDYIREKLDVYTHGDSQSPKAHETLKKIAEGLLDKFAPATVKPAEKTPSFTERVMRESPGPVHCPDRI